MTINARHSADSILHDVAIPARDRRIAYKRLNQVLTELYTTIGALSAQLVEREEEQLAPPTDEEES